MIFYKNSKVTPAYNQQDAYKSDIELHVQLLNLRLLLAQ